MSIEEMKAFAAEHILRELQEGDVVLWSATVNEMRMMSHKKKRIRKKYEDRVLRRDRMVA